MSAVRRLRADLDRVQASSDTLVLGREDLIADGLPEDPNDEAPSGMAPSVAVGVDAHHYALASLGLVGKIDPDMIHAPVYSNWPAQYRKLDAAMAPVKLLAARRSVDRHRLCCQVHSGRCASPRRAYGGWTSRSAWECRIRQPRRAPFSQ